MTATNLFAFTPTILYTIPSGASTLEASAARSISRLLPAHLSGDAGESYAGPEGRYEHGAGIESAVAGQPLANRRASGAFYAAANGYRTVVRTLMNLSNIDPGSRSQRLLLFTVDGSRSGYQDEKLRGLYERIRDKVAVIRVSGRCRCQISQYFPGT